MITANFPQQTRGLSEIPNKPEECDHKYNLSLSESFQRNSIGSLPFVFESVEPSFWRANFTKIEFIDFNCNFVFLVCFGSISLSRIGVRARKAAEAQILRAEPILWTTILSFRTHDPIAVLAFKRKANLRGVVLFLHEPINFCNRFSSLNGTVMRYLRAFVVSGDNVQHRLAGHGTPITSNSVAGRNNEVKYWMQKVYDRTMQVTRVETGSDDSPHSRPG
jgi:hypothetical protein